MYATLASAILKGLGHEETKTNCCAYGIFFPTGNDEFINMPSSNEYFEYFHKVNMEYMDSNVFS